MDRSRLEYGCCYILEFLNTGIWPEKIGFTPVLRSKFVIVKYFENNYPNESKYFLVTNCYGDVRIGDVKVGNLVYPTFFRYPASLPDFIVYLSPEILGIIEERRQSRDVYVSYLLKLLCSFSDDPDSTNIKKVCELDLTLNARIPKSRWLEEFLPTWDFYQSNEVMLQLTSLHNYPNVKAHVADARKAYSLNNYRESLSAIYRAIEALHKSLGYKQFGEMLNTYRSKSTDSKHEKISTMFKSLGNFLNLARHDQTELSGVVETKEITRDDAKMGLIYGQMIIEYIINNCELFK